MGVGPDRIMLSAFRTTAALRRCSPVALDWAKMASQVTTDSGRAELGALRGEIAEINKSLDSVPEGAANVDWGYWKTKIQTPGAVDQFEAAFNSLQTPALQVQRSHRRSRRPSRQRPGPDCPARARARGPPGRQGRPVQQDSRGRARGQS